MRQSGNTVTSLIDYASAALWLGVWAKFVPVFLGSLGILWFLIRFVNFVRVNVFGKDSWGGLG